MDENARGCPSHAPCGEIFLETLNGNSCVTYCLLNLGVQMLYMQKLWK